LEELEELEEEEEKKMNKGGETKKGMSLLYGKVHSNNSASEERGGVIHLKYRVVGT
jgi:hypothetical protein